MGFSNSKPIDITKLGKSDPDMSYRPYKLEASEAQYLPHRFQFIIGDGRLLRFDSERREIVRIPVSQDF